jgi:hypothetical protein
MKIVRGKEGGDFCPPDFPGGHCVQEPGHTRNEPHRVHLASRSYLYVVAHESGRENAITSSGNPIPGSSFVDNAWASA